MDILNTIKNAITPKSVSKELEIIAVTSQNYKTVTKHAGLTRKFLIYRVQRDGNCGCDVKIKEINRISLPKDEALHTCKEGVSHPIDAANVLVCGSCGEGFIKKMEKRGISVSVATKSDPLDAVREYLSHGERHFTCDGAHQEVIKRHKNCPHNKECHSAW